MNHTDRLLGRTALVTGAGRGIGSAIALAFVREGASVVLAARTESELQQVAAAAEGLGGRAVVGVCDVSDWQAVDALVRQTVADEGAVDVLAHAAGVYGPIGPFAATDPAAWARALEINLLGTFNVCRAVAGPMVDAGRGSIILLGGGGATAPLPRFSSYAATKAGVVRLAETLAEELKDAGVRVHAIAPGLVDTTLQDEVLAAGDLAGPLYDKIREARETGVGSVGPELAAELAVFLASDESAPLTGKLVAAPHDPWREWGARGEELNGSALYTLRRLDPFTLGSVGYEAN